MRSLDFTVCTRECATKCFRKLTEEERKWAEENYPYQSYSDFPECQKFKNKDKKNIDTNVQSDSIFV